MNVTTNLWKKLMSKNLGFKINLIEYFKKLFAFSMLKFISLQMQ